MRKLPKSPLKPQPTLPSTAGMGGHLPGEAEAMSIWKRTTSIAFDPPRRWQWEGRQMGLLSQFHKRGNRPEGRSILPKTNRWQSRGLYPVFWLNSMLFLLYRTADCSGPWGHPGSLVFIQAHWGGPSPEKNREKWAQVSWASHIPLQSQMTLGKTFP